MAENDRPTTIIDSFKTLPVATIRKLILEAEVYLEELSFTATLAVLKAAIGQKLECIVGGGDDSNIVVQVDTADIPQAQQWKVMGKFIATAGSLFERAGIPINITISCPAGQSTAILTRITLLESHSRFDEMMAKLRENGDTAITAKETLSLFEVEEESNAADTE